MSDFNDGLLAGRLLHRARSRASLIKGANNEDVQVWVVRRTSRRIASGRSTCSLHGGPHNGVTDAYQWRWNAQVFANWGYVTAWHNFHGSSGFGQAWADSITKEWMAMPYEDTIKAADWFRAQPWLDS